MSSVSAPGVGMRPEHGDGQEPFFGALDDGQGGLYLGDLGVGFEVLRALEILEVTAHALNLVDRLFARLRQRQQRFGDTDVVRPIARPTGQGAHRFVADGFVLVVDGDLDRGDRIRSTDRGEEVQAGEAQCRVTVLHQRNDVRQRRRAFATADQGQRPFEIRSFPRSLGLLEQPHQFAGLGRFAQDTQGVTGGAADARIRVLAPI